MAAARRRFATSMTGKMCDSLGSGQPGAEAAAWEEAEGAEAAVAFARPGFFAVFLRPAGLAAAEEEAGCTLSQPAFILAGDSKTGPTSAASLSGRLRSRLHRRAQAGGPGA